MNVEDAKKILLANIEILTPEIKAATEIILLKLGELEKKFANSVKNAEELPMQSEDLPNEVWRDIVGYEGFYKVSNFGRIKSLYRRKEKILKPSFSKRGYYALCLSKNGISKKVDVHILVAKAFIPNTQNNPVVHHKDSNPLNNNADNLEWVTYSKNVEHIYNSGTRQRKLTNEDIYYIRKVYKPFDKNFGANALARKFEVSPSTICDIFSGKYYKNI